MATTNIQIITIALNFLLGGYILMLAPRRRANQLFAIVLVALQLAEIVVIAGEHLGNLALAYAAAYARAMAYPVELAAMVHFALVYPKRTRSSLRTLRRSLIVGLILSDAIGLAVIVTMGTYHIVWWLLGPSLLYGLIVAVGHPPGQPRAQWIRTTLVGLLIVQMLIGFAWGMRQSNAWVNMAISFVAAVGTLAYTRWQHIGRRALITPERWAEWGRWQIPFLYASLIGLGALILLAANPIVYQVRPFVYAISYISGSGIWMGVVQTTAVALMLFTLWENYRRAPRHDHSQRQQISTLTLGFVAFASLNISTLLVGEIWKGDTTWINILAPMALTVTVGLVLARHRFLEATLDTIVQIVNSTLELDTVSALILEQLESVIDYDSGGVMLVAGDALTVRAYTDPRLLGCIIPLDSASSMQQAWNARQPVVVNDLERSALEMAPLLRRSQPAPRSWVAAPLAAREQVIGVISIGHSDPYRYNADDLETFTLFARQVSVAVDNARLYEEQRTRYEHEMEIARRTQMSLLPTIAPNAPPFEIAGYSLPAKNVGGDFFEYYPLAGDKLGVVVGDVSGKGMDAALMMAATMGMLDTMLQQAGAPARWLAQVNEVLAQRRKRTRLNAACCLAIFDPYASTMTVVNAGLVAPIMLSAGQCDFLDIGGLPMGMLAGVSYTEHTIGFGPGACFVFCSDGIVEAMNERNEMYGFERLLARLGQAPRAVNAQDMIEWVMEDVRAFMGNVEQHDDITLVVVRVNSQEDIAAANTAGIHPHLTRHNRGV